MKRVKDLIEEERWRSHFMGMVAEVGNLLGHVRTTNYGAIFDVVDLGSSGNNLAQTNVRINAHTDNPYRDPFPGVQLLHCLNNTDEGGATTFCDGYAAAAALRWPCIIVQSIIRAAV